ncbi:MAG: rRNA cytosine-C5-methyltransferase [Muribaculaceae bacterium]|nr:rRNA cytosine-C5-methyltransferase [Muribaculaceae bacterium]
MTLNEAFIKQIENILSCEEQNDFFKALDSEAKVSIRANSRKGANIAPDAERVKWCDNGKYLACREAFTFDPLFHCGQYYVQDASSMIISSIISRLTTSNAPIRYLDLCAAPGGKSTAALDTLPVGSLLVSNEIMSNRAQILKENIIKWGYPNCVVTNNDAKAIGKLTHFFDIIAADVPCSGEGMFRKDEEAVTQWTPALVKQCAERQRSIITDIWNALKPGGYLIYSTCTYNRDEDEEIIDFIVNNFDAESIDMNLPGEWNIKAGIDTPHHCYRFMPHITDGEGLFISVLRKSAEEPTATITLKKKKKDNSKAKQQVPPKEVGTMLLNPANYNFTVFGDDVKALSKAYADDFDLFYNSLKVIHSGILIGTVKGKDLIPAQALALNIEYNRNFATVVNVDYKVAIAYLRGESITLEDTERGYYAIAYNDSILGFVKNLGNRANNLYPKEWRIKSGYLPEQIPNVL